MSTETIETVTDFDRDGAGFLPVAPNVFYEFLKDGLPEEPLDLDRPTRLETGETYRMVVSHAHGARRYQTDDVFRVTRRVRGLPDLRFLRRHGLAYSFTGEKLTGEQLAAAYLALRDHYPAIGDAGFLTCFPSKPATDPVPHYKLTLVRRTGSPEITLSGIAEMCDRLLSQTNMEYSGKRDGQRLGPVRFQQMSLGEFRSLISGSTQGDFDAQFKFLPLYPHMWESLDSP